MSEQKYYVRLKLDGQLLNSGGFYDGELECDEYNEFTKKELAKMMDGALYKSADYCEFMELPPDWVMNDKTDKWLCEWINPLIELVPVEEEDVSN